MATQNSSSRLAHFTSLSLGLSLALGTFSTTAHAISSSELYMPAAYTYGRFEARVQFAFGDGIVSSFFLWKEGSEREGTFWNELDFEKLWADCRMETNALFGNPEMSNNASFESTKDLCGAYHTYAYEWTPDYIAWFVDGEEIRRESGATAQAFRDNAAGGMRIHLNVWPGDESFGGDFDPAILPVRQYINWVQYSAYNNGAFELEWREDFSGGGLPAGWATATWPSPKNLSTHASANVAFINGYAVLSVTEDNATGSATEAPVDDETVQPPPQGTGGGSAAGGAGGTPSAPSEGGASAQGGTPSVPSGSGGVSPNGQAGESGSGGTSSPGGASGSGGTNNTGGAGPGPAPTASTEPPPTAPRPTTTPSATSAPSPTPAPSSTSPQVPSSGTSNPSPQPTAMPTASAPSTAEPIDSAAESDGGGCKITSASGAQSGVQSSAWLIALGAIAFLRRQHGRRSSPGRRAV